MQSQKSNQDDITSENYPGESTGPREDEVDDLQRGQQCLNRDMSDNIRR